MADKEKKQIPLRLSKSLYDELMKWAEDDFRSLNGQIEYLLTDCVRRRKKDFDKIQDDPPENSSEKPDN
ncbi:MAG: PTS ascorbate transporter subunit IIC [Eubacteriales bacterium]